MDRIRPRHHALRGSRLAADHEVIFAKVELLERERHKRQVLLVETPREGQAIDEGRRDVVAPDRLRDAHGVVDMREDICLRE
jgi:hypothetical protein